LEGKSRRASAAEPVAVDAGDGGDGIDVHQPG